MEEASGVVKDHTVVSLSVEDAEVHSRCCFSLCFVQRLISELIGSYLLVFGGCAAIVVNLNTNGAVTLPGIAIVWGLLLMVLIYSLAHVSGAHFNPAVTLAFASCNMFPLKQVPAYISVQIVGSILASGTLRLIYQGKQNQFAGTIPAGSQLQSFVVEFVITFLFMFVISSLTTDQRATKSFAGVAIGATLSINVLIAGPVSGASVNPARSLGPAMVSSRYEGLWIYMVGPTLGATAGAWLYKFIGFVKNPSRDINRMASTLRRSIHVRSNMYDLTNNCNILFLSALHELIISYIYSIGIAHLFVAVTFYSYCYVFCCYRLFPKEIFSQFPIKEV